MSEWDNTPPSPPNAYELDKRVTVLENGHKTLKEELGKINGNLSRLLWVVVTAVVLAGLNMIMTGGVTP